MIVRRLCVLLNAERVYRELSTILEGETDLDFASIMVQVCDFFKCLIMAAMDFLVFVSLIYCVTGMEKKAKDKRELFAIIGGGFHFY